MNNELKVVLIGSIAAVGGAWTAWPTTPVWVYHVVPVFVFFIFYALLSAIQGRVRGLGNDASIEFDHHTFNVGEYPHEAMEAGRRRYERWVADMIKKKSEDGWELKTKIGTTLFFKRKSPT